MMLPGCAVLFVLLALTPAAAQQAPDITSLPVPPRTEAFDQTRRTEEVRPVETGVQRSTAGESTRYLLPNGLDLTVYGSDALASRLTWRGGQALIALEDGRYLSVITDIDDPSIYNKGDGQFHPFPQDRVVEVLGGITHENMHLKVTVYILPYPRTNLLVSSTSGNTIFLSPHVLDIHPAVCAYIVAHEMGHVFHNGYLPESSTLWHEYLSIRGIDDESIYYASASHPYRPREIFAEDFRVLFGGRDAAFGGRVENPSLPSPTLVPGLEGFIADIGGTVIAARSRVRVSSYPNPFNPETEIQVVIPDEILRSRERVTVRIYDVRGALVRELYSDVPFDENLYVRWDGKDKNGASVASAHYFALIEAGPIRATLKLVLLK
jgi:hypothetical protein